MRQGSRIYSLLFLVISVALIFTVTTLTFFNSLIQTIYAQPSVTDTSLNVEAAIEGLSSPTSMVFQDENNILGESERGLFEIATSDSSGGSPSDMNVFLYYTEGDPLRNRIYKYQWNGETLINPTLIMDLPAEPGPNHDGGKIIIGPDG